MRRLGHAYGPGDQVNLLIRAMCLVALRHGYADAPLISSMWFEVRIKDSPLKSRGLCLVCLPDKILDGWTELVVENLLRTMCHRPPLPKGPKGRAP